MMQPNSLNGPKGEANSFTVDADKPSCLGCRRRKLKCSRELPACTHCIRLDAACIYDDKKNKPGLKTGAVDSLSRRIEVLENAVLQGREIVNGSDHGGIPAESSQDILHTLSRLCTELCKLNARNSASTISTPISDATSHWRPAASPASTSSWRIDSDAPERHLDSSISSRKRRRLDASGPRPIDFQLSLEGLNNDVLASLPPPGLLADIVNAYFRIIQPWIPILHETRFRRRISDAHDLPELVVVLHAMVVAALRFVPADAHGLSSVEVDAKTKQSRSIVLLNAMDQLSVENLQALIIVAFDNIGNGFESRAWSIVGSLTRTVEYLQLSVENGFHNEQPVLKPLLSLAPPGSWVEEEERRRVFWNIFNLDRFCSVFTGWNTSLTADDVHRRLPADGGLWHQEEPVITPFFGIWTRAQAKMGNSIAFLPAHYPSPNQSVDNAAAHSESPTLNAHPTRTSINVDMSTVGAFAYCIEATESLSQVTTYFLQQRINFHDRAEVGSWLTRFKELDLRLVHWKMFLPERWKDSNISRQPALINMDPNLALAHLTHNTSMMLLHQRIAYPQAEWTNIVKLPSLCSAETCQNAAIETQNISEKYLKYGPSDSIVTNQFIFCMFVAARVLLVHWRFYDAELASEFWSLVHCLDELAARWLGQAPSGSRQCLARKFADQLRDLHQTCLSNPEFIIDILAYSTIISNQGGQSIPTANGGDHRARTQGQAKSTTQAMPRTHDSAQLTNNPPVWHTPGVSSTQNATFHQNPGSLTGDVNHGSDRISVNQQSYGVTGQGHVNEAPIDELSSISYMLLDQSFLDLDRVITLDEMMITAANMHLPIGNTGGDI